MSDRKGEMHLRSKNVKQKWENLLFAVRALVHTVFTAIAVSCAIIGDGDCITIVQSDFPNNLRQMLFIIQFYFSEYNICPGLFIQSLFGKFFD